MVKKYRIDYSATLAKIRTAALDNFNQGGPQVAGFLQACVLAEIALQMHTMNDHLDDSNNRPGIT